MDIRHQPSQNTNNQSIFLQDKPSSPSPSPLTSRTSASSPSSLTSPSPSPSLTAPQQYQNLTNIATYNLTKRKSLYNEMINQYANIGKMKLGSNNSYVSIYSYRPALYAAVATLYHLKVKKVGLIWIFMHAGALLAINQYDLNVGARDTFQTKWEEYEEATKNYELTLGLIQVPFWPQIKRFTLDKLSVKNYLKILENRPH